MGAVGWGSSELAQGGGKGQRGGGSGEGGRSGRVEGLRVLEASKYFRRATAPEPRVGQLRQGTQGKSCALGKRSLQKAGSPRLESPSCESPNISLVLSREWGNGLLGLLGGNSRDYHRDPFPHSLLRTRETSLLQDS